MSPITLAVTVGIIALLVVLGIWLTMRRRHTDHLRDRFGDEYERTVETTGDRARAEAALADREQRVAALDIRPLTADERTAFAGEWTEVKSVFVDSPAEAVLHADRMLANMMKAKGFPMADFDRRFEDLTVDHGDVARHYRAAHDICDRHSGGNATTEDMRQAMKHYEALYDRLLLDGDAPVEATAPAASPAPATTTTTERSAFDFDGDGRTDTVATDVDRDGDADLVRQDTNGDGRTDRVKVQYD